MMEISIVSLNYKKKEMTGECISSVYSLFKREFEKNEIEFLVIDNDSKDGSDEYLKKEIAKQKYKNVYLFGNKENLGFAKGCNSGAKHAKGEFVLFMNNDTKVLSKGFLEMAQFMKNNQKVAIMGAKMKKTDGTSQLSAWKFYTLKNAILMLLGFERFGMLNEAPLTISKVDWVTGGCMMVNKKIFDMLGGFDEHFFMYMEDMELCYRAKKAGYYVYYYPDIEISHIGQGSSNRTFAIINIYKGLLYFYKKHMPAWQYGIIKLMLRIKAVTLLFFGKISHNSYFIQTYEQALAIF